MATTGVLSRVEGLMGTAFSIAVHDPEVPAGVVEGAFDWLRSVEEVFSTFIPGSEVSRLGRGLLGLDDASPDVRHVLTRCAELEEATGHRFSIRPGRPGGPGLDPAAFVKGWAADEAAMRLRLEGLRCFSIDAGGDVLCVGASPDGPRWRVGVRHPNDPDLMGTTLHIASGAVATSATYYRGQHITGDHVEDRRIASVSVVGPSLGVADALATAIFADQATSLGWMDRFPQYGVILMTTDGRLQWTDLLDGHIGGD